MRGVDHADNLLYALGQVVLTQRRGMKADSDAAHEQVNH